MSATQSGDSFWRFCGPSQEADQGDVSVEIRNKIDFFYSRLASNQADDREHEVTADNENGEQADAVKDRAERDEGKQEGAFKLEPPSGYHRYILCVHFRNNTDYPVFDMNTECESRQM